MPSTFFGLGIATSGMSTYNAVLNTTGHNISNVHTEGYSRQVVKRTAKEAISLNTSFGMMGSGVTAETITNMRNEYYDYKYRLNQSDVGKYDIQSDYLAQIEDYLHAEDETVGCMTNSLDNMFTALKYLTTSPMDSTIRSEVAGYANTLAFYTAEVAGNLQVLQKTVNTEIDATVKQINAFSEQIASLNKQINQIEVYGERANDLRDQRTLLIDKLSLLVDVTVTEKAPADANGTNQFIVTVGGGVLVDTNHYNTLNLVTTDTNINQTDVNNLYNLEWSYGQKFDTHNPILGGKLQGLFDVRDGNNADNFSATLTDVQQSNAKFDGASTVSFTTDRFGSDSSKDLAKLNIPETNGIITIGKVDYEYDSFSVKIAADGTYEYTFKLKESFGAQTVQRLNEIMASEDSERKQGTVGDSVAFRGIPFYMAQLNEFARTFSASFNTVQNTGYDLNGDLGEDLLIAQDITSGKEFVMTEFIRNTSDGFFYLNGCKVFDATKLAEYQAEGFTTEAIPEKDGYYILRDKDGNEQETVYIPASDDEIFSFNSRDDGEDGMCYYRLTALNYTANSDIVKDGRKLACSSTNVKGAEGWEEAKNLTKMIALQTDNRIFKQGDPSSFLNVMTNSVLGVDSRSATASLDNSTNIRNSVDLRRSSVSGVDEDEEAQNLVICQNMLNYQYKVLSIMNEVLDKLINGTAV